MQRSILLALHRRYARQRRGQHRHQSSRLPLCSNAGERAATNNPELISHERAAISCAFKDIRTAPERARSRHRSPFLIRCNSFARFLFVTLVLVAAGVSPAAETASVDSATAAADQLKALNDRTIIQSRVWLDTEWDQFKGGAEKATWTLGGLWGWRVSDRARLGCAA